MKRSIDRGPSSTGRGLPFDSGHIRRIKKYTGFNQCISLFVAGPGIDIKSVTRYAHNCLLAQLTRVCIRNSKHIAPLVRFQTKANKFAFYSSTREKPRQKSRLFKIVLRGPESNRGLEVMSLPRYLSSTPLCLIVPINQSG